jgi:hypothetical protein
MNLSSIPIRVVVVLLFCLLCNFARWGWGTNDDAAIGPLTRLVDDPALRRRLVPLSNHHNPSRRRLLQTAYLVEIHMALYYVTEDVALAMKTKDPSNPVVSHFCKNVNEQVRVLLRR